MFRVVSVNTGLVRTMHEVSDGCVISTQLARDAGRRVGDLVATVSRGSVNEDCFFCLKRFRLRVPLRQVQVTVIQRIVQIFIDVRGGEYYHPAVFVANQEVKF